MRVLFAGSPAIAVPSLRAVSEMEGEGRGVALAGILTNPDRARRHGHDEPTDVSAAASALDALRQQRGLPALPQLKPERLDAPAREAVAALAPDLLVTFAYGRIFGPRFLALFPLGGINIHPSLLPCYRGAAPLPAAILAREKETGICIQTLAPEMDAGDLLITERFELSGRETTASLSETVSQKAAVLLHNLLADFAAARPQQGQASYCHQIKKEAGTINWTQSAAEIDAQIRAYTPWPLSFTRLGDDTLFILEARPLPPGAQSFAPSATPPRLCEIKDAAMPARAASPPGAVLGTDRENGILIQTGSGVLAVSRLQWQAKKPLDWKAFCNGARDFTGRVLGAG